VVHLVGVVTDRHALQLNTPQVDTLSAQLADVVRRDVQKVLPLLESRPPAQLLLPHLDGIRWLK
jgi:hypothetical protein